MLTQDRFLSQLVKQARAAIARDEAEGSDVHVHRFLCHPHRQCDDGCEGEASDHRLGAYERALDAIRDEAERHAE